MDVLVAGLQSYASGVGQAVKLDSFEISHHDSVNNMFPDLLDLVDCDRYLICTNGGGGHHHPNRACIKLIVDRVENPKLEFENRTNYTKEWEDVEEATGTYLDEEAEGGVLLHLQRPTAHRAKATPLDLRGSTP